jgi:hypothetical protein
MRARLKLKSSAAEFLGLSDFKIEEKGLSFNSAPRPSIFVSGARIGLRADQFEAACGFWK